MGGRERGTEGQKEIERKREGEGVERVREKS